jgi:hypothetical protein
MNDARLGYALGLRNLGVHLPDGQFRVVCVELSVDQGRKPYSEEWRYWRAVTESGAQVLEGVTPTLVPTTSGRLIQFSTSTMENDP